MIAPATGPGGLRERKKAETRRRIQETAVRLFLVDGYDATTVERIAAECGVSHMTFFRHFPTKESVVADDDYDPLIAALIRRRPAAEHPLDALRAALSEGLAGVYAEHRDVLLARTRLILTTPALRASMADNQFATERLFASALAARGGIAPGDMAPDDTAPDDLAPDDMAPDDMAPDGTAAAPLEVRVLAAAALAALTVALAAWVESEGSEHLPDLVDRAFAALHPAA